MDYASFEPYIVYRNKDKFLVKFKINSDTRLTVELEGVENRGTNRIVNRIKMILRNIIGTTQTSNSCQVLGKISNEFIQIKELPDMYLTKLSILELRSRSPYITTNVLLSKEQYEKFSNSDSIQYVNGKLFKIFSKEDKTSYTGIDILSICDMYGATKINIGSIGDNLVFRTLTNKVELTGKIVRITSDTSIPNGKYLKRFIINFENQTIHCCYCSDEYSNISTGSVISIVGELNIFKRESVNKRVDTNLINVLQFRLINGDENE